MHLGTILYLVLTLLASSLASANVCSAVAATSSALAPVLLQKTAALHNRSRSERREPKTLFHHGGSGAEPVNTIIARYQPLLDKLNIEVLQCRQSVEKLEQLKQSKPYLINAMVGVMGADGYACSFADIFTWVDPPVERQKHCLVYCSHPTCGAALNFVQDNKEAFQQQCGAITYLQGGAQCFVEQNLHLKNRQECANIVNGDR